MSIWIRHRDQHGALHYYLVPFEPITCIAVVGVVAALLLPIVLVLRDALLHHPLAVAALCLAFFAVGVGLVAAARVSVIRAGRLIPSGPVVLNSRTRVLYVLGYLILGAGAILVLLTVLASRLLG